MKLLVRVLCTDRFNFGDKSFVTIKGLINEQQICQCTVNEKYVPDSLEGKEVALHYDIGFTKEFKPFLKFENLEIVK